MFKYKIPIETGRWQNIAGNDKICTICRETIRDEFHYLFNRRFKIKIYPQILHFKSYPP